MPKLANSEIVLKCILNHVKIKYNDLQEHKKRKLLSMVQYDEGILTGLESGYYYITGEHLTDDEIKDLINNKELADRKSN